MKKQTIFTLLIGVLIILFLGYALETWYETPYYSDYCEEPERFEIEVAEGEDPEVIPITNNTECIDELDTAREAHAGNTALILIGIGLVLIVFAIRFSKMEHFINVGVLLGGALSIIYGVIRYWSYLGETWRRILIFILLVAIIIMATKYKNFIMR